MTTLHEFFLRSAARDPGAYALWADDRHHTYGELERAAARIAAAVQGPDHGEPAPCAVLVDKSAAGYASILGALLAGRAYVPLNPKFPARRGLTMLTLSGADTLVVDQGAIDAAAALLQLVEAPLRVVLPGHATTPAPLAAIDRHRYVVGPELDAARWILPDRGSPYAYILFTSGSTGVPRGVGVTHANACAYVDSIVDRYRPTPEDRFSQFFDFTFDLSVHDMFVCWAAGACLYAAPREALLTPVPYARKHALTFWFSVPSLAVQCRRLRLRPGDLPHLRCSLFCGEALPTSVARHWQEAAPASIVENLYGPTEATIAFTAYRCPRDGGWDGAVVPLGAPLPGQEALIVDQDRHPAPAGEIGELCLGGTQVAPGYWRSPEATAARFFHLKVPGYQSVHWFSTGDLASQSPDVGLLFHGRRDHQVKIRGYRVEIAEIEAQLRRLGGTDAVAVIPWPFTPDGTALGVIAFGCSFGLPPRELRERCAEVLPEYMVPTEVHELPALPTRASGKLDYGRLRQLREEQERAARP